jgi:uncharacterized hydrophobic protein (TIGR00271 family)
MKHRFSLSISKERYEVVQDDIATGSEPGLRFYILVAVSTGIACFGLISNSTAVVIGAMLVAPLMTPIFGISFALIKGDAALLGRAVRAEVVGVAVAVAMGFVLGLMLPGLEATPEMLSRTRPNLYDLIVAVLAGFAGSYALIDEKISPALPGVAIATAIVPPLANSGLCFSLGAIEGGIGSFLLFFANFLSILLVGSAIFFVSGMARDYGDGITRKDFFRRFSLAIVGFIVVAALLSHSLVQIMLHRKLQNTLRRAVHVELADMTAAGLDKMITDEDEKTLQVFLQVHSPRTFSPNQVKRLQDKMAESVGRPVELLVRTILTRDVSAVGHTNAPVAQDLDGNFTAKSESPTLNKIAITEQILSEYFLGHLGLTLEEVGYVPLSNHPIMLATVGGVRRLSTEEIRELESEMRSKTGDSSLELVVRYIPLEFYNRKGRLQYGWWAMESETPEIAHLIDRMKTTLAETIAANPDFHLLNVNSTYLENRFHLFIEIAGAEPYTQEQASRLKRLLIDKYGQEVELFVLTRPEVVASPEGRMTVDEMNQYYTDKQEKLMRDEMKRLLESAVY